jgi:hypothetical protein
MVVLAMNHIQAMPQGPPQIVSQTTTQAIP